MVPIGAVDEWTEKSTAVANSARERLTLLESVSFSGELMTRFVCHRSCVLALSRFVGDKAQGSLAHACSSRLTNREYILLSLLPTSSQV